MTIGTIPLARQIACVRREIQMRNALYPKWVKAGRKTQEAATAGIADMQAVLETLQSLATADTVNAADGLPMLTPDGELLSAEDIAQWHRWCCAAVSKMESATALGGWLREMAPHFTSLEKVGHWEEVQLLRDAAMARLDALAEEGTPA